MQILGRIDRGVVNADLVVQVRAGAVPRRADIAKDVSAANVLSLGDREPGKMSVKGLDAVAVVDDDFASVPGAHAGLHDGAIRRCAHRVALVGGDVDPGVERAFPIKGVQAGAEGTGYDPLHRPKRGRVRQIHYSAESRRKRLREVEPVRDLA